MLSDGTDESTGVNPEWVLDEVKRVLTARVSDAAEAARLRYITGGAGQALTYDQKLIEARAILADTAVADAMTSDALRVAYPMTWASIPADGSTPGEVASRVAAMSAAWFQVGAAIEKARRDAAFAIEAAPTIDAAVSAADVDWSAI